MSRIVQSLFCGAVAALVAGLSPATASADHWDDYNKKQRKAQEAWQKGDWEEYNEKQREAQREYQKAIRKSGGYYGGQPTYYGVGQGYYGGGYGAAGGYTGASYACPQSGFTGDSSAGYATPAQTGGYGGYSAGYGGAGASADFHQGYAGASVHAQGFQGETVQGQAFQPQSDAGFRSQGWSTPGLSGWNGRTDAAGVQGHGTMTYGYAPAYQAGGAGYGSGYGHAGYSAGAYSTGACAPVQYCHPCACDDDFDDDCDDD
jgi:hypothetical protein